MYNDNLAFCFDKKGVNLAVTRIWACLTISESLQNVCIF